MENALKQLGGNIRTARIRRRLTIKEMSEKTGAGVRAIAEAEKGNPSTSIVTYTALLWVLGMLENLQSVADPSNDAEGQALALGREAQRARIKGDLDNDF